MHIGLNEGRAYKIFAPLAGKFLRCNLQILSCWAAGPVLGRNGAAAGYWLSAMPVGEHGLLCHAGSVAFLRLLEQLSALCCPC